MQTLLIALGSFVAYLIAYHTYGRWLSRKIFNLDPANKAPSVALEDGEDFVPTSKGVVFGHHFTSIATSSIFPCVVQTPIAVAIGLLLHRKGMSLLVPSIIALAVMYLSVAYGDRGFLHDINSAMAAWPVIAWVALLLVYSYIASVLPVWILLQPRDYINALQLLSALGLVVIGLVVAGIFGFGGGGGAERQSLEIVAPMMRIGEQAPAGAPWIFPFLFVTIACGAISGFHCLVSSGTSSKQLKCETDAQFVGYGSMLTEGFLAVLVILACVAGIGLGVPEMIDGKETGNTLTGEAAYAANYSEWGTASKGAITAFVSGSGNFIQALGLGAGFATALMGVFVASFAATTMDSACRLQRYVTQELAATLGIKALTNKHAATIFAVILAAVIAAMPPAGQAYTTENMGKGGLVLWPLFGATNQLLGGLAFLEGDSGAACLITAQAPRRGR